MIGLLIDSRQENQPFGSEAFLVTLVILLALVIQLVVVGVLLLGDIGFDHRGKYGLDFGHGIVLCGVYLIALGGGTVLSVVKKKWYFLVTQMIVPALCVATLLRPTPTVKHRLDASQYQHLIGKTKEEVKEELRNFPPSGYGWADGIESVRYDGMAVYYSSAGRVVKVEPSH